MELQKTIFSACLMVLINLSMKPVVLMFIILLLVMQKNSVCIMAPQITNQYCIYLMYVTCIYLEINSTLMC